MRMLLTGVGIALFVSAASAETVPVKGEVTKINEAQNKLTLKHEAIPNLDMESMTMVFTAADPAMLEAVKVGDKVVFEADRVNGRITVTRITKTD